MTAGPAATFLFEVDIGRFSILLFDPILGLLEVNQVSHIQFCVGVGNEFQMLIAEEEGGEPGVGELCIKTPAMFQEYWRKPEVSTILKASPLFLNTKLETAT